jgi:uncharacterized protein YbgA (DUF1722 family)
MEKQMCQMIQTYLSEAMRNGDLMDHHLDEMYVMLRHREKVYNAFGRMMDCYCRALDSEADLNREIFPAVK